MPYTLATTPTTLDMSLLGGGPLVQGTVVDAGTQAGVDGATVYVCVTATQLIQPFGNGCASATTSGGGHYPIDSRQFRDTPANGYDVIQVFASQSAYFN